MYIKYLGNIHNMGNYNSFVKGGAQDCCIHLQKDNGHFHSMEFKTTGARNFILNEIWEELKKESKLFDIDDIIETYYISEKYKV